MIYLTFQAGDERYGIPSPDIVEVLPVLDLRQIPQAPGYVAGALDYHGKLVPVIDMSKLIGGEEVEELKSARIVVGSFAHGDDQNRLVGILVEDATETISVTEDQFQEPIVDTPSAPYLGKIETETGDYVQLITVTRLLSEPVRDLLYPSEERSTDAAD